MTSPARRRRGADERAAGLLGLARRHGVWLGLGAILVASVASLCLQYAMSVRLAAASPLAERARLASRVEALASHVAGELRARARQSLDVLPSVLVSGEADDVDTAFRSAPADGVEIYFIVRRAPRRPIKISLYDPRRHAPVSPWADESRGELSPLAGVARNGSVQWFPKFARGASLDPAALGVFDAVPPRYVVTKPVVDGGSMVAVAGMIVNKGYYRGTALPLAFQATVEEQMSERELGAFAFTLEDETGLVVRGATDAGAREPEASAPVEFPFPGWRVAARSRGPSYEELSNRQFAVGAIQQILVLLLLVAGGVLAARAWARQTELLRMKSDFLSNVTHELQSPITSIRLYAELLRSGRLRDPAQIEECGAHVEREATRLRQLVTNILDFAKIDAGRKAYRFRDTDLGDVTRSVLDAFEGRIAQAGLVAEVVPFDGRAPRVVADPDALAQVIANLVDNAIKYSPRGGRIAVRFSSADGTASVAVSDEGVGIPPDEHGRIFERFYRVAGGLEHDAKGSGIGLAIVRHVVEAHHGTVMVASEPGRGSTFTVTLPALAPSRAGEGSQVVSSI